jgi:hypothetical protein
MKKITIIFTLLLLAIRASDLDIPDGMFLGLLRPYRWHGENNKG